MKGGKLTPLFYSVAIGGVVVLLKLFTYNKHTSTLLILINTNNIKSNYLEFKAKYSAINGPK